MTVSVMQPNRDSSDNSALIGALGIARDLFKVGMDENQQQRAAALAAKKTDAQTEANILAKDRQNKIDTNTENDRMINHLKDWSPATQGEKGAMPLPGYEGLFKLRDKEAGKAGEKVNEKYDKAHKDTLNLLETTRSAPAVQQAERDVYAADKANSLVNLYGDPNQLTMPQVHLLAAEIGKIASGGQSTQAELEHITPQTLFGQMSNITTRFTNDPTPANAAEFVKQYQDYAKSLSKDAKNVIVSRYGRILEANKSRLNPEDYGLLKTQYINRFTDNTSETEKSGGGGPTPEEARQELIKRGVIQP